MAAMNLLFLLISLSGVLGQNGTKNPIAAIRAASPGKDDKVDFLVDIEVQIGKSPVRRDFVLDTTAPISVLSKCKSSSSTRSFPFTFTSSVRNGFFPDSPLQAKLPLTCTNDKNKVNVAALGSSSSSLQAVFSKSFNLPLSFAYCLGPTRGQLSIGRTNYYLFNNSDVLDARPLTLIRTPLSFNSNPRSGYTTYTVQLKKIFVGKSSIEVKEVIEIGTTSRFTALPGAAYDLVRLQVLRESIKKKVPRESTSFGPLPLCYRMSSTEVNSFPDVVMLLGSKARWRITPGNYFVAKPGATNVYCFGFLKAGPASVIGTLQQENMYVEFNEGNKTLGFSEPLLVKYRLGCAMTTGS